MSDLDASHETVRALEQLLPEAITAGGSFAGWLPCPWTAPADGRAYAFALARETAVTQCVRDLLRRAGLNEYTPVARRAGGELEWPEGFVGSLSHKGAVVLGVIAECAIVPAVGIDIERADGKDLGSVQTMIAPEGLPGGLDPQVGTLLSFSAKEAVFKAQYPLTRRRLDFSDVRLDWTDYDGENIRAAVGCSVRGLVLRAALVHQWVVSVALLVAKTSD